MKKYLLFFIVALVFPSLYSPKQAYAQYQSIFGENQTSWKLNKWAMTPEFIVCIPDSMWIAYNQDTLFQEMVF